MEIIKWVQAHWLEVSQAIAAIIGVASIIVKLTPSLKDDTILQKIVAFIGRYIALNKTVRDEDRPK